MQWKDCSCAIRVWIWKGNKKTKQHIFLILDQRPKHDYDYLRHMLISLSALKCIKSSCILFTVRSSVVNVNHWIFWDTFGISTCRINQNTCASLKQTLNNYSPISWLFIKYFGQTDSVHSSELHNII